MLATSRTSLWNASFLRSRFRMGVMNMAMVSAMERFFTADSAIARAVALHVVKPERQRSTAGNRQQEC